MKNIYKILTDLEATNSRLEKEKILQEQKPNTLLQIVLIAALNPHVNFYIKKIPPYTPATKNNESLAWALTALVDLSSRTKTGNEGIAHLAHILSSLDEEDAIVIERIIQKDLRCGVSEATVNKIWKGLIPSYPVMLASGYDEKLIQKMQFPAIVQTKFDGMRFNAIVNGDSVEFKSRNGKDLNLFDNLKPEFRDLAGKDAMVYDGELLVVDEKGKILDRKTGNGILSKAQKGTISKEEAARVVAVLWDAIPYAHFTMGKSDVPYNVRLTFFTRKLEALHKQTGLARIRAARSHIANDLKEAQALYRTALESGEEGIILKDSNNLWEDKRSKSCIKFKAELEADLLCTEWVEGEGKYKGMLGSVILTTRDKKLEVSVGSGFNDEQRKTLKKKDVVGKIITVKYNALITNKSQENSLFLPIFIEIREDKTRADAFKDLK